MLVSMWNISYISLWSYM